MQAKDVARHNLASWADDPELPAVHACVPWGLVALTRRRHGTRRAYVVVSQETCR